MKVPVRPTPPLQQVDNDWSSAAVIKRADETTEGKKGVCGDEGVPTSTHPLLAFRRLVRSFDDRSTGPIIVHCSGGVGRTGTFIALDSLLDMGQAEGKDQYVFLYTALLDGLYFNVVTVFAEPVYVTAPCTVGWSV
ncbi:hypothetical protein NP493_3862g00006 [Ridgeia piscesae]|uniref:Protein tyrosine phosphatase n=1 Tax=Ridgeia piscesae TaxID=27915 RepID=A0AAD9J313_RIDPI|nr:hypothetical protein NP493_3862g00006 [Ridgeia piscesae]